VNARLRCGGGLGLTNAPEPGCSADNNTMPSRLCLVTNYGDIVSDASD